MLLYLVLLHLVLPKLYPQIGLTLPFPTINQALDIPLKNALIPILQNTTVSTNITGGGVLNFQLHSIHVSKAALDLSNALSSGQGNTCKVLVNKTNLTLQLNISVVGKRLNYPNLLLDVEEMDITMKATFDDQPDGWGFKPVLSAVSINEQKFKVKLRNESSVDSTIVTALLNFLKSNINQILDNLILGLNDQLAEMSSQPEQVDFQFPFSTQPYISTLKTLQPPNFPYDGNSLMNVSLSISLRNTANNATYIESQNDQLYKAPLTNQTHLEFGGNFMAMLAWAVQQSGLSLVLNDFQVPKASPFRLRTDSLALLMPGLWKYEAGLGVYLQVQPQNGEPSISLRSGRIAGLITSHLSFFVDKSSQYGNHSLAKCLKQNLCQELITLQTTLSFQLAIKTSKMNFAIANVIEISLSSTSIISSSIELDVSRFEEMLNSLLRSQINPANQELLSGVEVSTKYHFIKDVGIKLEQALGNIYLDLDFMN